MNTDARAGAAAYYQAAGRDMERDLAALSAHPQGVVLLMPQLVVLMKPVLRHEPTRWTQLEDTPAGADAWYAHLLVGDLQLARRLAYALPPLPWLCFQRGRRSSAPHYLPWAAFCHHSHQTKTTSQTMGFSNTSNYRAASTTIPVVTQSSAEESQQMAGQTAAQKKGLLSTILNSHRRKEQGSAAEPGNTTLG